jgi:hypothetical protein
MDEHALETLNPPQLPERPIRYGVTDLFATVVLFGVHLATLKSLVIENTPGYELETVRIFAGAALSAAFAFGGAYLSFRFVTKHRVQSSGLRLTFLIVFDLILLSIPVMVYVFANYWIVAVVVGGWAFLLALPFILLELAGRLNPGRRTK